MAVFGSGFGAGLFGGCVFGGVLLFGWFRLCPFSLHQVCLLPFNDDLQKCRSWISDYFFQTRPGVNWPIHAGPREPSKTGETE